MAPLALEDRDGHGDILGVNVVDVNPAHQLLAFGIDGNATVQFWDQRSRTPVGVLKLPAAQLVPTGMVEGTGGGEDGGVVVGVTAIASRQDGLSYAIGTTTGHTLLYDIRASKPYATKDQGYGLPVKSVAWIEGGSRMAGDGLVISADKKVIKIWDRNDVRFFFFFCCLFVPTRGARKLILQFFVFVGWVEFRLDYARDGPQRCASYTGERADHDCERGDPDEHVLHPTAGTCTPVGELPGEYHGGDGGPKQPHGVRGLQVCGEERARDVSLSFSLSLLFTFRITLELINSFLNFYKF